MSRRLLIVPVLVLGSLVAVAPIASASDGTGQNGGTTAGASTGDGTVTVGVGIEGGGDGSGAGTGTTPPTGGSSSGSSTPPAGSDPAPTYTCSTGPVNLAAFQQALGVGGPEPGYWAVTVCTGPGAPAPTPAFWVTIGQPGTPGAGGTPAPPPSPAAVALEAEKQLHLPATPIEMAPPASSAQLVNVAAWFWLAPSLWRPVSATASIDGVAASAVATPEKVVWQMGDGDEVTCDGPGTPYDPSDPSATSDCTYTWTEPSAGEPGGAYTVTATTTWQVTWAVVGAAGGGSLGLVAGPTAQTAVVVTESQAINTPATVGATGGQ